jgi:hypothetical protein
MSDLQNSILRQKLASISITRIGIGTKSNNNNWSKSKSPKNLETRSLQTLAILPQSSFLKTHKVENLKQLNRLKQFC